MFALYLLIALAKKKANKFTPAPTPEQQQYYQEEEREVHYYHYEQPRHQQQYVRRDTVVIDSSDDLIGLFAVIIVFILVVGAIAGCASCCNSSTPPVQEPITQPIRVETITTTTRTTTPRPVVESTISWKRYNEVINDSATTANDYNNLLTGARKMIDIANQYGLFVKQIPKKLDHFMSTARYKTTTLDVSVDQFNRMVEDNRILNKHYNKLVDISNEAETTLLQNNIRF